MKFGYNRPTGSGEEDFKGFFYLIWHGSHIGHVTKLILINFHSVVPEKN